MVALLFASAWGQATEQQNSPPTAKPRVQAGSAPSAQQPANSAGAKDKPQVPADESQQKISPKAAEELFRSVDEILKFASKDSSLPIHEEVKRRLVNRDEVVAFIRKHMAEDEDAQRLQRSELVLKKFGLLPRDFDLQTFLVALLREQVVTHALQDQSFGLEKYMKAGAADLATSKKEPSPEDIENDEESAAHQAVVEGQAMVVLIDFELAPVGQSVVDSPQIVEALKAGMQMGTADSIEFRNAPLYIKEALTFPYRYGLDFEVELLTKMGKDRAYAGVFRNPPRTTREIMEPHAYLSGEKLAAMPLPDFKKDFKGYDKFDVGAVGEFDVSILVDQYQGEQVSKRLYPHWRGGYYYAARPHGDASASLGLLYVSRWSSAEKASEFAWVYAKGLEKRYRRVHEVADEPAKAKPANYTIETLTGKHAWLTEDGSVFISVQGDTVMVSESLDQDTTERVEREIFPVGK